uniref:type I polyketide synthase n=1 Tax=uncultured Sphingomonas sp. TaxID=158754 RepID=UPI0025E0A326
MADTTLHEMSPDTALAIVGMAGRFPGAAGVDQFWQNVAGGIKSIRIFSEAELEAAGVEDALLRQPNYVKAGTVVADVELFDAAFFGYNPREAELMDPQHRLFLECAWEALERAACDPDTYGGRIGVFAGSGFSMYMLNNLYSNPELIQSVPALQIAVGNERDSLASTVSYKLNLKGPSIAVQTFCSTSLVATHLACQSLLTFESDVALAGGVAINIPQEKGYEYHEGDIVSPDGECRTFDAAANGSVIGNGVGVVALKRLEDALEDGDVIYAVIRGSAVNNDGILKVGYTAPGMSGQASVITEALANAGVEPDTISYVEAHGTATPLGDAVELAAMHKAFTARTAQTGFCALGSVKPNVGHLDRASGVTGLIKTALALQHQQLPPSLNFAQPNPALDLHDGPFYVNTTLRDWPRGTTPRRAGVSSFGLGGTNAHVVLEEAPERAPSPPAQGSQLLLLSAKTTGALEAMAANLAAQLERQPELNLADVAYTLQVGRSAFNHRRMVVAADMPAAVAALRGSAGPGVATAEQTQRGRPVAFLLPGQADVTALDDLRRTLYASEPAFRAAVEQCCAALRPHLQVDLLPRFAHRNGTTVVAPAEALLFVTEYALTQVLGQWGVRPSALLGAGIGEYVAACLAGVVSLADAAALVAARVAGAALPAVTFQPPRIPYLSQLSGTWITPAEATDPAYWMRLLAQRGDTALDLAALDAAPQQVYVEMGPGTAMSTLVPARLAQTDAHDPAADARTRLLHTLGRLWLAGVDVEWAGLHTGTARRRVALPTYPFERRRYWVEAQRPAERAIKQAAGESTAGGKQAAIDDWFYLPVWKQSLGISEANLPSQTQRQGPWLLLLDESGLGRRIEAQPRAYGCDLIAVRAGAFFTQHDP